VGSKELFVGTVIMWLNEDEKLTEETVIRVELPIKSVLTRNGKKLHAGTYKDLSQFWDETSWEFVSIRHPFNIYYEKLQTSFKDAE
jgi:hypothetical protein